MTGRTDLEQLVYTMSADIKGMQRQLDRAVGDTDKASRKIEKRIEAQGVNVKKALTNVFDRSKFKLIEDGASRISVFGSAIAPLGPAGIAAAVGIVTLAEAFHQAREAMAFVDELHDTAKNLHVTTDALQEYRYAVRAAGGEEKGADDSLRQFGITLGKAQEGLTKSKKAFKALGFSDADIKSWKSVEEALVAVSGRIAQLKSNPQRDAVIDQFGLSGMKELVQEGPAGMAKLRAEAHATGVVMDAELIKRAADLNDEFETATRKISMELKSAFIDAGPALLKLVTYMAQLAHFVANVVDDFHKLDQRGTDHLKDVRQQMVDRQATAVGRALYGANDRKKIAQIDQVLAKRAKEDKPEVPTGDRTLVDQGAHSGPSAADKRARGLAALDDAMKSALQAQAGLTDNVEALAKLKADEVDVELKKKVDQLRADIAGGKINEALARQAITAETKAAADKKALIRREAEEKLEDRYFERQRRIGAIYDQVWAIEESLARTVQARLEIERRILAARQRMERADQQREFDRQKAHGTYDASAASADSAALADKHSAEIKSMETNAVRDLAGDFKSGILDAFQALKDGGAAGVIDYLANRFKQGILDAFAEAASKRIASALLGSGGSGGSGSGILSAVASIFGFGQRAAGGPVSGGSPYLVGEKGPELIVPGQSGTVIPNHLLGGASMGRGRNVSVTMTINAPGSMMAQEFVDFVNRSKSEAIRVATLQGVAGAAQVVPARMGRGARQRFR